MLRSVLQTGSWIGVVLLFPFLLLAVVVGGCTGGDQQRHREEQTPTPLATASEDDGAGQTPTPNSVNSTHKTVTATPTELVDAEHPAYCNPPGTGAVCGQSPSTSTSSRGRQMDGISCLTMDLYSQPVLWMVP